MMTADRLKEIEGYVDFASTSRGSGIEVSHVQELIAEVRRLRAVVNNLDAEVRWGTDEELEPVEGESPTAVAFQYEDGEFILRNKDLAAALVALNEKVTP